jgi:hypothetical protein
MRIDGGAHQRSEREVGPLRPKSQKIAAQRQILARQLSGMSGIFLRTGRDLQRLHWLADDAVHCEPVSAPKFPANREINREFCRIRPSMAIFMSDQRADSIPYSGIPCATEQGISKRVSGKIFKEQGIGTLISGAAADPAEHARRVGRRHAAKATRRVAKPKPRKFYRGRRADRRGAGLCWAPGPATSSRTSQPC